MTDLEEALPVLPRELPSISADVRAVGAPPTPVLGEPYHWRIADPDDDAELISEWMNRPHLAETWEYDWPPPRWRGYLLAQVAGVYSRPFVGSFRGKDIAYLEVYRAAKDSIAPRYAADPHDLGIHAAIADLKFLNKGMAPMLLPRVVASLFELEPQCRRICSTPTTATAAHAPCANGPDAPSSGSTTWPTGAWRSMPCRALPRMRPNRWTPRAVG
jgi:lysine N-acyltransferase